MTEWNQKYAEKNIILYILKLIYILIMSFNDKEELLEIRTNYLSSLNKT